MSFIEIASHFSLQNYGFSIMQHSVFLTCNFLQKVLAKNKCLKRKEYRRVNTDISG